MNRVLLLCVSCILAAAGRQATAAPAWWEQETALGPGGSLSLKDRPWWPKAAALGPNEQLLIRSELPGGGLMLLRREPITEEILERNAAGNVTRFVPKDREQLVWIIDDDGDMDPNNPQPDPDNDCYIFDHDLDGVPNSMRDYMPDPDNPSIITHDMRFFDAGELRNVVFYLPQAPGLPPTEDRARPRLFFFNKYNPDTREWFPISENPWGMFDTDGDQFSEIVVRGSGTPLDFSKEQHPDYANSWTIMWSPMRPEMASMGIVNIRYSFDIDNLSSEKTPYHYEMGFNMIGSVSFDEIGKPLYNPLRREPKAAITVPYEKIRPLADHYHAETTGFTWMEYEDGNINIGIAPGLEEFDRRWEGVFWAWHRRIMHNTGGPIQIWNIRREYLPTPSARREVYYSPVDQRLHLKGATEGWTRLGCVGDKEPIGEVRMFDMDGDGYFDRWEYYREGEANPYRVALPGSVKHEDFGDHWEEMADYYNNTALPESIRLNEAILEAFGDLPEFDAALPENISRALARELSPGERRYILELAREELFVRLQHAVRAQAAERMDNFTPSEMMRAGDERRNASEQAWEATVSLARTEAALGEARLADVPELIRQTWSRIAPRANP